MEISKIAHLDLQSQEINLGNSLIIAVSEKNHGQSKRKGKR